MNDNDFKVSVFLTVFVIVLAALYLFVSGANAQKEYKTHLPVIPREHEYAMQVGFTFNGDPLPDYVHVSTCQVRKDDQDNLWCVYKRSDSQIAEIVGDTRRFEHIKPYSVSEYEAFNSDSEGQGIVFIVGHSVVMPYYPNTKGQEILFHYQGQTIDLGTIHFEKTWEEWWYGIPSEDVENINSFSVNK